MNRRKRENRFLLFFLFSSHDVREKKQKKSGFLRIENSWEIYTYKCSWTSFVVVLKRKKVSSKKESEKRTKQKGTIPGFIFIRFRCCCFSSCYLSLVPSDRSRMKERKNTTRNDAMGRLFFYGPKKGRGKKRRRELIKSGRQKKAVRQEKRKKNENEN